MLSDADIFSPRVYNGSTLTEFPRPVLSFSITDSWDFRESKVPLADREDFDGQSRNGKRVSVSGQIAISGGIKQLTEIEMIDTWNTFVGQLDTSNSDNYELFVYHDAVAATYRKYKNASTIDASIDLGDDSHVTFTYSVSIKIEDPVLYQTSEGN